MTLPDRDHGLDTLLDLHGQTLFLDDVGHWVKFVVVRTDATLERPARTQLLVDAARAGRNQIGRVRQRALREGTTRTGNAETR